MSAKANTAAGGTGLHSDGSGAAGTGDDALVLSASVEPAPEPSTQRDVMLAAELSVCRAPHDERGSCAVCEERTDAVLAALCVAGFVILKSAEGVPMSDAEYRTFSVDYTGGHLAEDVWSDLHDSIVDLFEAYGLKVEGASDGPMETPS